MYYRLGQIPIHGNASRILDKKSSADYAFYLKMGLFEGHEKELKVGLFEGHEKGLPHQGPVENS